MNKGHEKELILLSPTGKARSSKEVACPAGFSRYDAHRPGLRYPRAVWRWIKKGLLPLGMLRIRKAEMKIFG
jgi:hypothetical protein